MGIKNSVFIDNSAPQCDAAFLNSVRSEVNNIITNTNQSPTTSNLNQLGIASSIYAAGGQFYTDSGVADAYVLSPVGAKSTPPAYFIGMSVRFIVGHTNTGVSTINVNGLGVKTIKGRDGSSSLTAGDLIATREVQLTYGGTYFYVSAGVPYEASIFPVGAMIDYAGTSAPSGWLLCYGQAVSRVTYATLFGVISTAYGIGDGSSTFNLPDYRGRASVGLDNMGGSSANRLTSVNADSLNNTGGGAESNTPTGTNAVTVNSVTLSQANLPSYNLPVKMPNSGYSNELSSNSFGLAGTSNSGIVTNTAGFVASGGSGTSFTPTATSAFTGSSMDVTQPWLAGGKIIKV